VLVLKDLIVYFSIIQGGYLLNTAGAMIRFTHQCDIMSLCFQRGLDVIQAIHTGA
jgi:hypothetical protein